MPPPVQIKIEKPLAYLKWEEKLYRVKMPKNSSPQTQKELAELLKLQQKRTADVIKAAVENQEKGLESSSWVARSLKFSVDSQHFPATTALLEKAISDVEAICYRLEFSHLRPKPAQLESKIKSVAEADTPPFPSLVSCRSYIQASIMSSLYPAGRDQFSSAAYDVARFSEWGGTHFPSDNAAAQKVAETAYSEMRKNPNFLRDFEKAKNEWKRFR